jgi:hypothetical protein
MNPGAHPDFAAERCATSVIASWSSSWGKRKSAAGRWGRMTRARLTGPPRSSSQNASAKTNTLVSHTYPAAPSSWPPAFA